MRLGNLQARRDRPRISHPSSLSSPFLFSLTHTPPLTLSARPRYRGTMGRSILKQMHLVFNALPLCSVIQSKVLVIHGGLADGSPVKLDQYRAIDRRREPPVHDKDVEARLMECALWSDPTNRKECVPSQRGAGVEFGKDCTHAFLRKNHLALIIRSHEVRWPTCPCSSRGAAHCLD